mgnify:CR=1 FL=1
MEGNFFVREYIFSCGKHFTIFLKFFLDKFCFLNSKYWYLVNFLDDYFRDQSRTLDYFLGFSSQRYDDRNKRDPNYDWKKRNENVHLLSDQISRTLSCKNLFIDESKLCNYFLEEAQTCI